MGPGPRAVLMTAQIARVKSSGSQTDTNPLDRTLEG